VDTLCVILETLLVPQSHSTDLAPEPISFDLAQMLPLEVFHQVSWTRKFFDTLLER
jgi:hypothetical protein